jgi:hypothetical protein
MCWCEGPAPRSSVTTLPHQQQIPSVASCPPDAKLFSTRTSEKATRNGFPLRCQEAGFASTCFHVAHEPRPKPHGPRGRISPVCAVLRGLPPCQVTGFRRPRNADWRAIPGPGLRDECKQGPPVGATWRWGSPPVFTGGPHWGTLTVDVPSSAENSTNGRVAFHCSQTHRHAAFQYPPEGWHAPGGDTRGPISARIPTTACRAGACSTSAARHNGCGIRPPAGWATNVRVKRFQFADERMSDERAGRGPSIRRSAL